VGIQLKLLNQVLTTINILTQEATLSSATAYRNKLGAN
jgi:hypothetical protein